MNYIKRIFSGRIDRKNYGLGILFFMLLFGITIAFVLSIFSASDSNSLFGVVLMLVLYIFFVIHNLSLHIRRFHDLGDNGWRVLLFIIPLVNLIIFASLLCRKGQDEPNKYGASPKKDTKFFDAILNRNWIFSSE